MIGLTPREQEIARAGDGPATGINLALAELSLYWDNHRKNAPDVHQLRINIRIAGEGSVQDRIGAVERIADWLGVEVHERYGVHIAQRRFGSGGDSVIVEAHFTPDQDAAFELLKQQAAERLAAIQALADETLAVTQPDRGAA
jgi:hypothetical protein